MKHKIESSKIYLTLLKFDAFKIVYKNLRFILCFLKFKDLLNTKVKVQIPIRLLIIINDQILPNHITPYWHLFLVQPEVRDSNTIEVDSTYFYFLPNIMKLKEPKEIILSFFFSTVNPDEPIRQPKHKRKKW